MQFKLATHLKKMKLLLLIAILITIVVSLQAQIINKAAVDERLRFLDSSSNPKQTRVYIINGISFQEFGIFSSDIYSAVSKNIIVLECVPICLQY